MRKIDTVLRQRGNEAIFQALSKVLPNSELGEVFLLRPLFSLCEQLAQDLSQYEIIVSDDASGRVISVLVKSFLDQLRADRNLPNLKLIGLASGANTPGQRRSIEKLVKDHRNELRRALIVTETVQSGESIQDLVRLFAAVGLQPDVATVSTDGPVQRYAKLFSNRLIAGGHNNEGALLYKAYGLTGVMKGRGDSPFPVRYKDYSDPAVRDRIQQQINQSRLDAEVIATVFARMLKGKI